jgi:hypothetical protein
MSIILDINALKVRLQNNPDLNDWFLEKFGKDLQVKKIFKNRAELSMAEDFPLIMITRPQVNRTFGGSSAVDKHHDLLLYCGFYYDDAADLELPLDYFIELDDLLERAVITKTTADGDKVIPISIAESANDQGLKHPFYFMSMHTILRAR